VDVIAGGDRFDLCEAWIFDTSRQYNMADYSVSPEANRCETHPYLKSNPRLLRYYAHRSAALHQFREPSEELDRQSTLASEVFAQSIAGAEVRLVAVSKHSSALQTFS